MAHCFDLQFMSSRWFHWPQKFKIFLLRCSWSKMLVCACVCVISFSAFPLCIGFWLCSVGFFFHHIVYLSCLNCFLRPSQYSVRICNDCDLNVENTSTFFFFNVDLALQLLLSSLLYRKFYFKDYYIILLLSCICK